MGRQITVTGIIHPLGWGCGFACDSTPTYDNPIIPADGGYEPGQGPMNYMGIFNSLDDITFTPSPGDMVQIPDGKGRLIEYVWTGTKWDDIGELILVEGDGIEIDENKISVKVMEDTGVVNTNDGIGLAWSEFKS